MTTPTRSSPLRRLLDWYDRQAATLRAWRTRRDIASFDREADAMRWAIHDATSCRANAQMHAARLRAELMKENT